MNVWGYVLPSLFIIVCKLENGESAGSVLFNLPEQCRTGKEESYFIGLSEARVAIIADTAKPYPPNVNCTMHIVESGVNAGVDLSWMEFDMAPPDAQGVCGDYVEVFKMEPETNNIVSITGKVCGSSPPANTSERVNELIIQTKTSSTQGTYLGYQLHYIKTIAATNPNGNSVKTTLDTAMVIGIVFGVILALIMLVLCVVCIICTMRHDRDLLRRKKTHKQLGYGVPVQAYLHTYNPPPAVILSSRPPAASPLVMSPYAPPVRPIVAPPAVFRPHRIPLIPRAHIQRGPWAPGY